jgi:hypothetical protein
VANPESDDWLLARQETAETLRGLLDVNLQPTRWQQVREILKEIAVALAAPRPDALLQATETLELYMPVRVGTRLGDPSREPAPGDVREQVAELVDSLEPHGGRGQAGQALPGTPGQAAGRGA